MILSAGIRGESGTVRGAAGSRFWEVDAARGVAILMMVVYHLAYDLYAFGGYDIQATTGAWARFADLTAGSFLFLVGVSLAISRSRIGGSGRGPFRHYLFRGLKILGYGIILTAIFLAFGMGVVAFGILHLIGVSIILSYPFLTLRWTNLLLGAAIFAAGLYIRAQGFSAEGPWLLPFGVVPENLVMPDYRPLMPWFGVVLVGLYFGNVVYADGNRPTWLARKAPVAAGPLLPLGRNSLLIYLVHQPILIAALAALGIIQLGQ